MRLTYLTGRAHSVQAAVTGLLSSQLSTPGAVILLVPSQFTLQAERDALEGLDLPGSFELSVLSPERLYARVFEGTGWPREARVDEQGRTMLMHAAAARLKKQLTWYAGAVKRPGFAERATRQIAAFKQAGLSPEDVHAQARSANGALARKLHDLALLYDAYERALVGRFLDGEDEQARAARAMPDAPFLRGARVCVHGFDLLTPKLINTIVALCGCANEVTVALTLECDRAARDAYLFEPVARSLDRLTARAREAGIEVVHRPATEHAPDAEGPLTARGAIGFLEAELFAVPSRPRAGAPGSVQLALCKNPDDEAEFAAALARRLARTRGFRYKDMAVACASSDLKTMDALRRAFARAEVPLFLAAGRGADRHPLAQCVLSALRIAARGVQLDDMVSYIRSGFSGLDDDEADLLVNYAVSRALRGRRWLLPLQHSPDDAAMTALEAARARLVAPLERLIERLRAGQDTRARLTAVYQLLEELDAYGQLERTRLALEAQGLSGWAMEGAQVWKRVLDALDQMDELLGAEKLSAQSIYDLMRRALSEAQVRALPQSADAVEGGELTHLKGKRVKALIVVGASDAPPERDDALLSEDELALLPDLAALTGEDRSRMTRLRFKSLLALTGDYLLVTRPQSDASGRALQPGALMAEISRVLPGVGVRGGVADDEAMRAIRLEQLSVAAARLPALLAAGSRAARICLAALEALPEGREAAARMRAAASHRVRSEQLPRALAEKLLSPTSVSASRLERFARCPFEHFAQYALRPEEFRPFELSPRDAGTFYHAALEAFVSLSAERLSSLSPEDSRALMDQVLSDLAERQLCAGDALAAQELKRIKGVARRAAAIVARQAAGSRFRPVAVEAELERGEAQLNLDERGALSGRIDRVDEWKDGDARYLRVIDYKTGGRALSLTEIYHGLQLQLMVYLASVLRQRGGKPSGAFYFNVSDPLIETEERDEQLVERAREKKLRLNGLTLKDERVVRAMAAEPELSLGISFNKDGSLRASDRLLSEADFDALIAHTLGKSREHLAAMRLGDTSIAPYSLSGRTACEHCEHRTLCQFDERLGGAARVLQPLTAKQVLEAVRPANRDES
ncbi:MAG: PD-(D/E)XK nuclease family protein [Christensenellaceae bacterium]|nr:PD-(D/E)XK nuclease family protein [Christensenellaceae bacterium]